MYIVVSVQLGIVFSALMVILYMVTRISRILVRLINAVEALAEHHVRAEKLLSAYLSRPNPGSFTVGASTCKLKE